MIFLGTDPQFQWGGGGLVVAQWQSEQVVLGSIPSGDQIFLILYYLKSLKEREYI